MQKLGNKYINENLIKHSKGGEGIHAFIVPNQATLNDP
jgi:hypothetical protein